MGLPARSYGLADLLGYLRELPVADVTAIANDPSKEDLLGRLSALVFDLPMLQFLEEVRGPENPAAQPAELHPSRSLLEKLEVTDEQLERLRAPRLTRELSDGSFEEPSFQTVMRLETELKRKFGIEATVRLGLGLHHAGIVTTKESDWLDEVRNELDRIRPSG